MATRFLAGFGAHVLRIDPPWWNGPGVQSEVTIGRRRARLDLKSKDDRNTFEMLFADADVLADGYRPGALSNLGDDPETLRRWAPRLVQVQRLVVGLEDGRDGWSNVAGILLDCGLGVHQSSHCGSGRAAGVKHPVCSLDCPLRAEGKDWFLTLAIGWDNRNRSDPDKALKTEHHALCQRFSSVVSCQQSSSCGSVLETFPIINLVIKTKRVKALNAPKVQPEIARIQARFDKHMNAAGLAKMMPGCMGAELICAQGVLIILNLKVVARYELIRHDHPFSPTNRTVAAHTGFWLGHLHKKTHGPAVATASITLHGSAHVRPPLSNIWKRSRCSLGKTPNCLRNVRRMCSSVLKPQLKATDLIGKDDVSNMSRARSSRIAATAFAGVMLMVAW